MAVSQDQVIEQARGGLGVPYMWGGDGPKGWDCSGFVIWVLKASKAVPKDFPDMNADGLYRWAVKHADRISTQDAFKMGCALIFRIDQGTRRMNHVGFASRGKVVEARGKKYGTVERDNPGTFTHAVKIPGVI